MIESFKTYLKAHIQQFPQYSLQNSEEDEDIFTLDRIRLADLVKIQWLQEFNLNGVGPYTNYLDIWSLNKKIKAISDEEDSQTLRKLLEIKVYWRASQILSFGIMTAAYTLTNGFKCDWNRFLKYSRHIFCIGSGTIILPKYLINDSLVEQYKYLADQQNAHIASCNSDKFMNDVNQQLQRLQSQEFLQEKLAGLKQKAIQERQNKNNSKSES